MSMSVFYDGGLDLIDYVRGLLLSPLLSGPLLAALDYAPEPTRTSIHDFLASSSPVGVPRLRFILQVLLALGVLRTINNALSSWASNNWRLTARKGWDWPKEVAVVTGGSSGIGLAVVNKLNARGVKVAILDLQPAPESIKSLNNVKYYRCDVTSSESLEEAANAVRKELGHPTILVNNAGIAPVDPIIKMSEATLHKIFNVNAIAHWLTVQQFLPRMIQLNKGHVITMGSLSSYVALPRGAPYSATKAAALSFHESLRCEIKHFYKSPGIVTTVVLPNFVATPLLDHLSGSLQKSGVQMLTTDSVAEAVAQRVWSRRGGHIILPRSTSLVAAFRGFPTWLQELVRDAVGRMGAQSMQDEPEKR